ncbi:hypothetical protein ACFYPZ_24670 [Streptomyces sp. NPDC005506]|uniref:hypothetical protein n=1 Tax=Streptomyces sp. NPDC005506 TaxID=3364718 RepID=UPI0036C4F36E
MSASDLVEMAIRSVGRSEVLTELPLAFTAITRSYVSGTRGLARWSGLGDHAVRETVGPEGGLSEFKFLWTMTRGTASPTVEDRDSMEIRYQSNTRTRHRSTSSKDFPSLLGQGGLEGLGALLALGGRKELVEGNAVTSAPIGERAQQVLAKGLKTLSTLDAGGSTTESGRILAMLDPGLDLWAEIHGEKPRDVAMDPLGRRAWHLAVLCGLEDVTLSVADVEELTGLSKRGAQALLARMTAANSLLVQKVRQGRTIAYEILWASNYRQNGGYWDNACGRDRIRKARAARDRVIQEVSARRGTGAGYIAYLHSTANPKRDEYLAANPLPADADGVWVALVEAGDELALYGHLRAQEAEAGPVPNTPGVLVGRPAEKQVSQVAAPGKLTEPARESLEAAVVSQELLAEMRKRVVGMGSR